MKKSLKIGDKITLVGFPSDASGGFHKRAKTNGRIEEIYQNLTVKTDASAGPGSSGSPILFKGELAGVITSAGKDHKGDLFSKSYGFTNIAIDNGLKRIRKYKEQVVLHNPLIEEKGKDEFFSITEPSTIESKNILKNERSLAQINDLDIWEKIIIALIILILLTFLIPLIYRGGRWIYDRFYYGKELHDIKRNKECHDKSREEISFESGKKLLRPTNLEMKYSNSKCITQLEGFIERKNEQHLESRKKTNKMLENLSDKTQHKLERIFGNFEEYCHQKWFLISIFSFLFIGIEFLSTTIFLQYKLRETNSEVESWFYSVIIGCLFALAIFTIKKVQHRFPRWISWIYWLFFIPSITIFVGKLVSLRGDLSTDELLTDPWFIACTILISALAALIIDYISGTPQDTNMFKPSYVSRKKDINFQKAIEKAKSLLDRWIGEDNDRKNNHIEYLEWHKKGAKSLLSKMKNDPQDIVDYCRKIDSLISIVKNT